MTPPVSALGPIPRAKPIQIRLPDGVGRSIHVATINLAQDWPGIRPALLRLIETAQPGSR
jgi:hypothetical protein